MGIIKKNRNAARIKDVEFVIEFYTNDKLKSHFRLYIMSFIMFSY